MESADQLLRERKYDEAVEAYGKMLETYVQEHGQLHVNCGLPYYKYGNALLQQAEAQADVFGDALAPGEEDKGNQSKSDTAELLEISWECLETARVVLVKAKEDLGKENKLLLAKVHQRLGDHSNETGQFQQAVGDYDTCLKIREKEVPENYRLLADAHYSLAEALNNAKEKKKALIHFKETSLILGACLKQTIAKEAEEKKKTATAPSEGITAKEKSGDKRKRSETETPSSAVVTELKQLLLDVQVKIEETEEGEKKKEKKSEQQQCDKTAEEAVVGTAPSNEKKEVEAKKVTPTTTVGFGSGSREKVALAVQSTNTLSVRRKKAKIEKAE
eukprot:g358.t1